MEIKLTYTVYADVLFILNFIADFICVCISLYICRLKRRILHVFASALIGGIYSVLSLYLSELPKFPLLCVHTAVLIIICAVSAPTTDSKSVLRLSFIFFLVSSLCGGISTSVFSFFGKYVEYFGSVYADVSPINLIIIIISAFIISIPLFIKTRNRIKEKTVCVTISRKNKNKSFDALVDTGNLLSDPISGDCIILLKEYVLRDIFDENNLKAIKKLDVLSENFPCGIRLISTDRGLIPIFRPEKVEIKQFSQKNKKLVSALIGIDFSEGSFGGAGGLLPASLI